MTHRRKWWTAGVLAAAAAALGTFLGLAGGQQIHKNGFEARDTLWVRGPADGGFRETVHQMTEDTAHTGQRSETVQLNAEQGSYIHYFYDTGRAPLGEEFSASVWIKANRPGIQLLARLVLPHERNPKNLEEPLTALIRGDTYQTVSRWQRLEVRQPLKLAREQQQLLRAELQRDVNIDDAYVDRMVLNLYGGPGQTDVWIDDLEVGPVAENPNQPGRADAKAGPGALTGRATPPRRPAVIDLDRDQLTIGGKRFFFRAIRHTDTPLKALRDAGFNTVVLDEHATPEQLEEAANLGFWVVPSLPLASGDGPPSGDTFLTANSALTRTVSRLTEQDAVLFWHLGPGGLPQEQAAAVARTAQLVRAADPQRPLAADVWDGFGPYSRSVQLLGVHRWPLMTGLELPQYREWLNQRRLLVNPNCFLWTWVQTHLPDWHTNLVYDRSGGPAFQEPVGPLPEQIRLLTYTALASGARGLGFWSDRFLADSHQGRDRLLAMALLNQEIQMLEPLLVAADAPTLIDTSVPEVKAAVFRTEGATLVLPIWMGYGAQYVPGQAAKANLTVTVPQVPIGMQAWEVSPGDVRSLKAERVVGGTKVTIPEFGVTSAVVFTADNGQTGLLVYLQDEARKRRKLAAQWAHDLAEAELDKVTRVYEELEQAGHPVREGREHLQDARKRLQTCADRWNDGDYREAYLEAKRAARPLGVLMRDGWEEAARDLDLPTASPYAVSYFTLPRHWRFAEQIKGSSPGANVLPGGDFELAPERAAEAWTPQEITLDEVELLARRIGETPQEGRQCLLLEIKPKNAQLPPQALERTFLAIHSPAVRLEPGTLVRISGWVRIPEKVHASADGALLYDSAGGEPLAVRLTGATKKWQQLTWYRRVPPSGTINVTLALTGIGKVYFDDVRVEPLRPGRAAEAVSTVSLRSPKKLSEPEASAKEPGIPR